MGIRGTGRKKRQGFVDEVAERDPELAAKLEELRHASPAAYRKRIRALAKKQGGHLSTSASKLDVAPTPGRATDPKLRVGPGGDTAAEDARDVATIRALEKAAPATIPEVAKPAPAEPESEAPKKKKGKKPVAASEA